MPKRSKFKRQKRKNRITRSCFLRGGNGEKVNCCICEKMVDKNNTFIPMECLMAHGDKTAHRICSNCWWNSTTGFALEKVSHKCPGCVKNLPLTAYKKEAPAFINLTED